MVSQLLDTAGCNALSCSRLEGHIACLPSRTLRVQSGWLCQPQYCPWSNRSFTLTWRSQNMSYEHDSIWFTPLSSNAMAKRSEKELRSESDGTTNGRTTKLWVLMDLGFLVLRLSVHHHDCCSRSHLSAATRKQSRPSETPVWLLLLLLAVFTVLHLATSSLADISRSIAWAHHHRWVLCHHLAGQSAGSGVEMCFLCCTRPTNRTKQIARS